MSHTPGGLVPSSATPGVVPGATDQAGQLVRAPKTAELIAGQYRRQIVRGELRPGDTLPSEQQLMVRFGVSRPTLREAFRILETENLISVRRGSRGGARVTQPSLSVAARYVGLLLQVQQATIADVYQARAVLEPACAGLLARHRRRQDLADLGACVDRLRGVAEAGPGQIPGPGLTHRFHELIMQRCGSKTLAVQGGVLQDIVATHLTLALSRGGAEDETLDDFRRSVRSYEKLVVLVDRRDETGAERHWRAHMEAAGRRLLRDLQNRSVVDLFA
jgi:GntR family transcriptional regulator, transcriptional repressor for pyruvate dehydrogenase complex